MENAGNGISETLDLKPFWGSMPPADPPRLSAFGVTTLLPRVRVHLQFKVSRYASVHTINFSLTNGVGCGCQLTMHNFPFESEGDSDTGCQFTHPTIIFP